MWGMGKRKSTLLQKPFVILEKKVVCGTYQEKAQDDIDFLRMDAKCESIQSISDVTMSSFLIYRFPDKSLILNFLKSIFQSYKIIAKYLNAN